MQITRYIKGTIDQTSNWMIVLLLMVIISGVFIVIPHLTDEVWQDEAYTLFRFANRGFWYPFTDYHVPNNHALFSAFLSKWWKTGDSLIYLRSLPLFIFVLSLMITALAAKKLGGIHVALLATIMFAANNVTEAFALQLRGYGFSWLPVTAAFIAVPLFARNGNWYWGIMYLVAAAASVAILPTNILFCLIFVLWGLVQIMNHEEVQRRTKWCRALIITSGPLLGMVTYVHVFDQLLTHSNNYVSNWHKMDVLRHWLWATMYYYALMTPIFLLGLVRLAYKGWREPDFAIGSSRNNLVLFIVVVITVPAWLAIFPNAPFPRNFVPFLPVWCFLAALLFVSGWNFLFQKKQSLGVALFLPLTVTLFTFSTLSKPCISPGIDDEFPQDLCRQFYHEQYFPTKTVQALGILSQNKAIPVLTDLEGFYSLGFVIENTTHSKFKLMNPMQWENTANYKNESPPLVVTRSKKDLEKILGELGLLQEKYVSITTTGYYKIFGLSSIWPPLKYNEK